MPLPVFFFFSFSFSAVVRGPSARVQRPTGRVRAPAGGLRAGGRLGLFAPAAASQTLYSDHAREPKARPCRSSGSPTRNNCRRLDLVVAGPAPTELLRRNTGVLLDRNGSPASLHRGGGRRRAEGREATQSLHTPRTHEGRLAETFGPGLRDRRPLERGCAIFCSRPGPASCLRAPPAVRAAASSGWAWRW